MRDPFKRPPAFVAPAAPALPAPTRTNVVAGAIATAAAGQGNVRWIEGTFMLPNTYLPAGGDSAVSPFGTVLLIFGEHSSSWLMAGYVSQDYGTYQGLHYSSYVWWQWGLLDKR